MCVSEAFALISPRLLQRVTGMARDELLPLAGSCQGEFGELEEVKPS